MDYTGRFFLIFDELKRQGLIKNYVELSDVLGTNKSGINDLKSGRKKLTIEHLESMKKSYPLINIDFVISGTGKMIIDNVDKVESLSIKQLIDEIKDLSAQNERLKMENERLIKDIKNKSNPRPYPSMVAESQLEYKKQ